MERTILPTPAITVAVTRDLHRRLLPIGSRVAAMSSQQWQALILTLLLAWIVANGARIVWLIVPVDIADSSSIPELVANAASVRERDTPAAAIDIEQVVRWHLFGNPDAPVVAEENAAALEIQAQDTALNLQLVGLMQSNVASLARAILFLDGRQQQFAIGEPLPASGKVVLSRVLADRAIIDNNGRYETLWLYDRETSHQLTASASAGIAPASASEAAVDPRLGPQTTPTAASLRDQLYRDPASLADLIQISVQADGVRIRPGRDPQAFAAFGLRTDDIVTAINGVGLGDPKNALGLFDQMRTAQQASLTIRRGNEDIVIVVSLQESDARDPS
jgi:general secretion pathway protein C